MKVVLLRCPETGRPCIVSYEGCACAGYECLDGIALPGRDGGSDGTVVEEAEALALGVPQHAIDRAREAVNAVMDP